MESAEKPGFGLVLEGAPVRIGMSWDVSKGADFAADNVGVMPLSKAGGEWGVELRSF
jgi:hypothetical protein